MKIFLTGGTGVIGRPLVPLLVAAGHDVRAVCRREDAAVALRGAGAEPVTVDLFDAGAVRDAVSGSEAVLHLATNVPPMTKAGRPKGWEMHSRLRTVATRHLVDAARTCGASHFVKESITFTYRDGGDEWLTEDSPLFEDLGLLAPTIEGETDALKFAADGGAAIVLRFGLFYGGEGNRGTDEALKLAKLRRSTIAGSRQAYMSSVHVDDGATAVAAAMTLPTGIYNVGDDEPLRRGEFLAAFGLAFAIKTPKPTPALPVKVLGGSAAHALLASQRVSNARFRSATGWEPKYPSAREGWAAVAADRKGS